MNARDDHHAQAVGEHLVGETISHYELIAVIGHGSTGTVYRAVDGETGRTVAVKRFAGVPTPAQRSMVLREARTLAGLDHPSVLGLVAIIDEPDHLGLVTEYAAGGSLRELISQRGRLSPVEVVTLLRPVAAALDVAHRDGVVHRDVKPSNILLRADGTPLLADFGLATVDPGASQTSSAALGSAAYLDPEVVDGALPSSTSDLYSLGVVGYELLTGEPPYTGESALAVLRAADRAHHVLLDPSTHGPLASQVERAFARRPQDRFPTAGELITAWELAVHDRSNVAATPTGPDASTASADSSRFVGDRSQTSGADESTWANELDPEHTAVFSVRSRPPSLIAAAPVRDSRPRRRIAALAAAGIIAVGGGTGFAIKRAHTNANPLGDAIPFAVRCDPTTTAQCVKEVLRTTDGISVQFVGDDAPTRYQVGQRDDQLRVSNFFCGAGETLAVYRPGTGVVYYFDHWPLPGETQQVSADRTGVIGANAVVSDHDSNGCGDLGLEHETPEGPERVWLLPSAQPERLETVAIPMS